MQLLARGRSTRQQVALLEQVQQQALAQQQLVQEQQQLVQEQRQLELL